jgi:hypothetical protein
VRKLLADGPQHRQPAHTRVKYADGRGRRVGHWSILKREP